MDLGAIFTGFIVMEWVFNLILLLGFFTLGYIIYMTFYTLSYYVKFKQLPTNQIEFKYINILEENKTLKEKIIALEEEHNVLFNELLERLKEK